MEEDIQRVGNFFSAWREKGVCGCWRDYSVRGKKRSLWFFGEIFSPRFGQIFQSVGFERYGGRVSEKIQTVLGRGSNRVSLKKDSVWQEKRRGCVVERERKHDQIFYFLGIVDRSCGIKAENFLLSKCETRTTYIGREVDIYIKSPTPSLTKKINIPIPSLTKRINIITYNR